MSNKELYNALKSINGFATKVAEDHFKTTQSAPFIIYYNTDSNNYAADNKVYYPAMQTVVELYEKTRSSDEQSVEIALNNLGLVWSKSVEFIDDQSLYQITYRFSM